MTFELVKEYTSRSPSKMPTLTIDMRWIAHTNNCTLCPGGPPRPDGGHLLSLDVIGAVYKPLFFEFVDTVRLVLEPVQMHLEGAHVL